MAKHRRWKFGSAMTSTFAAAILFMGANQMVNAAQPAGGTIRAYVGTYTQRGSQGIYQFEFDPATGQVSEAALAADTVNPSFLAVDPTQRFLYAVNEVTDLPSDLPNDGSVTAFQVDSASGGLKKLNSLPSGGGAPCHLSVADGSLVVANYVGGSVASLEIAVNGELAKQVTVIQHSGSGANPQRQEGPHVHCATFTPDGRFAIVADLGLDRLFVYAFNSQTGELTPHDPPYVSTHPGAGPRHVAFHPQGKFLYSNNELDSTVTAYAYDAAQGTLEPLNTLSTLPEDFDGSNSTAEIAVHPSGKFVYVSNRGHDSIAIFVVQPDGTLTAQGQTSTGGRNPRNFCLDPTGRFLLAANQDSDSINVFTVDASTGGLEATGASVRVVMPVCVLMSAPRTAAPAE